jgi:hypothetical protein
MLLHNLMIKVNVLITYLLDMILINYFRSVRAL